MCCHFYFVLCYLFLHLPHFAFKNGQKSRSSSPTSNALIDKPVSRSQLAGCPQINIHIKGIGCKGQVLSATRGDTGIKTSGIYTRVCSSSQHSNRSTRPVDIYPLISCCEAFHVVKPNPAWPYHR